MSINERDDYQFVSVIVHLEFLHMLKHTNIKLQMSISGGCVACSARTMNHSQHFLF